MKRMVIPAFVLLFSLQAFSQDVLTMRSGAKYEVKLLEINDTELRFKMYNNPHGPIYTISRNSFASILYENGVMEEFALQAPGDQETIAINGYNVAATNAMTGTAAGPSASEDYPEPTREVSVRGRRSNLGQVVGAIFNTGLLVLDIAAEFQAAKKCVQQQTHTNCCSN